VRRILFIGFADLIAQVKSVLQPFAKNLKGYKSMGEELARQLIASHIPTF
jgi:hypothetical protein